MAVNFPAFAHLVTVFGSTLKSVATSAGVRRVSGSPPRLSNRCSPSLAYKSLMSR